MHTDTSIVSDTPIIYINFWLFYILYLDKHNLNQIYTQKIKDEHKYQLN